MHVFIFSLSLSLSLSLSQQVKDMKERLEEAESMGVRRMKAQVQAMEGRVASLEEQLDAATRSAHTHTHTHTYIDTHMPNVYLQYVRVLYVSCIS